MTKPDTTPAASASRHTPEPWQSSTRFQHCIETTFDAEYPVIATGVGKADKERIVSCVNALAGMNPEAVKGVVSALEVCLSRLDHTAKVQGLTLYANNERDHARAALAALKESK